MFAGTLEQESFSSTDDAAEAGLMAGLRCVDESKTRRIGASEPLRTINQSGQASREDVGTGLSHWAWAYRVAASTGSRCPHGAN